MSEPSDNQKIGTTLQCKAVEHCNVLAGSFELLDPTRHESTCMVNTLMKATYWVIVWRIEVNEQAGQKRTTTKK
jgi:hypothetical protein